MPIQLNVKDEPVVLTVKSKDNKTVSLAIRKTLDGNMIVQDHHSMNIIIVPDKGKIISFPKGEYNQDCYSDQDDLFKFLTLSGVVKPETVNGGNIYGSMEAGFITDKLYDEEPLEVVILNLYNFLQKHKARHAIRKKYIDDLEKQLINPDEEDSTELGQVPQDSYKGSIPKWGFPTRGVYRYNY